MSSSFFPVKWICSSTPSSIFIPTTKTTEEREERRRSKSDCELFMMITSFSCLLQLHLLLMFLLLQKRMERAKAPLSLCLSSSAKGEKVESNDGGLKGKKEKKEGGKTTQLEIALRDRHEVTRIAKTRASSIACYRQQCIIMPEALTRHLW